MIQIVYILFTQVEERKISYDKATKEDKRLVRLAAMCVPIRDFSTAKNLAEGVV